MFEKESNGMSEDERTDFVIALKRKMCLENGKVTDADVYFQGVKDGIDPLTQAHNTCKELAHQANQEASIAKQAVKIIRELLYVYELGKNELAIQRAEARAKQFIEKHSENA